MKPSALILNDTLDQPPLNALPRPPLPFSALDYRLSAPLPAAKGRTQRLTDRVFEPLPYGRHRSKQ